MSANNQQPSAFSKIPFLRTRLFWGVVMGIILISIIYFYFFKLHIPLSIQNIKELLIYLPAGFIAGISIASLTIIDLFIYPTFTSIKFIILFFVYYSSLILLLYKTFKYSKIKMRYPFLFIIILGLSIGGYYFLLKMAENF